jgi:hypothetical protein
MLQTIHTKIIMLVLHDGDDLNSPPITYNVLELSTHEQD